MKQNTKWRWFLLVLIIDFAYTLFNYILDFGERDDNLSWGLLLLLHLVPLVALIIISRKIPYFEKKSKLPLVQKCLIVYLAASVLLGLAAFSFNLPRPISFLFYSRSWWFDIVYFIRYEMYYLAIDFAITVLYWISYAILLADISNRLNPVPEEKELSGDELQLKTSASFKISIANMICLILQTGLNSCIVLAFEKNKGGTGEQAIGMAIVGLILIAIKFLISLPVLILSIVGIVKSRQQKSRLMKNNHRGFVINVICLVISELQVFLWW